jgi:hypothetical protein
LQTRAESWPETRVFEVYVGGRLVGYTTEATRDRMDGDPMIQKEIESDFAGLCR